MSDVTGVRLVDLPALGAVTDASKVAGCNTGAGLFSVPALKAYFNDGLPLNAASFGALGNGVHDDAAAINAAIVACATDGGGVVTLSAGSFAVGSTIILHTKVTLQGGGRGVTTITGLPGTTMDILQTVGFAGLVGTNTPAGPYQWVLKNLSVNGSSRAGGRCISIYGYAYIIEDVEFFGAADDGCYSEWSTSGQVPVAAGGNGMEARFFRTSFFSNNGNGLTFNGPHDTIFIDCLSYINAGVGGLWQQSANYIGASVIMGFHSYGNQQVGIQTNTSLYVTQLQSENNRATGGINLVAPTGQINGSNVIVFQNTGYGIAFNGNSSTVASMFVYNNSTDGIVISGQYNVLSAVSATNNGGAGLIVSPGAVGTTIDGIISASNGAGGMSLQSGDIRVSDMFVTFNAAGGIGLANGLNSVRLSGEVANNTGTQVAFGTLGQGSFVDLTVFTAASPQVAWSGVTGANFVRVNAIGYDARAIQTQFSSDLLPTLTNTTNIGSPSKVFANIWVGGINALVGIISQGNIASVAGSIIAATGPVQGATVEATAGGMSATGDISSSGGSLIVANNVQAGTGGAGGGYLCRAGKTGAFGTQDFNLYWTGSVMQLWVDATNLGTITTTSDLQYKHAVEPVTESGLDRISRMLPIRFRYADKGMFRDDGVIREGFIAQDIIAIVPSAVEGALNGDQPLSLNPMPLIATLVKAVQELTARVVSLEALVPVVPPVSSGA